MHHLQAITGTRPDTQRRAGPEGLSPRAPGPAAQDSCFTCVRADPRRTRQGPRKPGEMAERAGNRVQSRPFDGRRQRQM